MRSFPSNLLFIYKNNMLMENNQKQYKRQDRSVSVETARKISSSLKTYNGTHPRTPEHSKRISDGLKKYWGNIPPKKDNPIATGEIV